MRSRSGSINLVHKRCISIDICFQSKGNQLVKIRVCLRFNAHGAVLILNKIIDADAHEFTELNEI